MPLTIDDETDRVAEQLAARLRVGKIEAMRVALANELRLREASLGDDGSPPPGHDRTEATGSGQEGQSGLTSEPE